MNDVRFARSLAFACASLIAVLTVACGSGSDSNQEAAPATSAATPPPTQAVPAAGSRGALLSVTDVVLVTKAQSDTAANIAALAGPALCDVLVKSIVHNTVAPNGDVAKISGAL